MAQIVDKVNNVQILNIDLKNNNSTNTSKIISNVNTTNTKIKENIKDQSILEELRIEPITARVTTDSSNLNIRTGEGTNTKVITSIPKGSKIELVEEYNKDKEWTKVKLEDGTIGYVSTKYITLENNKPKTEYIVQPGDTLSKIAKEKYNGDYETLAKYNNISNPNQILPGQVILIPPTTQDLTLNDLKEAGESLSKIANNVQNNIENIGKNISDTASSTWEKITKKQDTKTTIKNNTDLDSRIERMKNFEYIPPTTIDNSKTEKMNIFPNKGLDGTSYLVSDTKTGTTTFSPSASHPAYNQGITSNKSSASTNNIENITADFIENFPNQQNNEKIWNNNNYPKENAPNILNNINNTPQNDNNKLTNNDVEYFDNKPQSSSHPAYNQGIVGIKQQAYPNQGLDGTSHLVSDSGTGTPPTSSSRSSSQPTNTSSIKEQHYPNQGLDGTSQIVSDSGTGTNQNKPRIIKSNPTSTTNNEDLWPYDDSKTWNNNQNKPRIIESNLTSTTNSEDPWPYDDSKTWNNTNITPTPKIREAENKYKDELNNSQEKYVSNNTFMTISNKNVNGYDLRVTHTVVSDPSQVRSIQSKDNYGTGGESLYSMANRTNNLVVAATGSFFLDGKDNLQGANNIVIRDGKLVDHKAGITSAGGHEICLDNKGKLFYAPEGIDAQTLINDYGVVNTFTNHESRRLDNGQIIQTDQWDKGYDRTYLCMKEPGEYYLIQGYSTPEAVVNYAQNELGCTFVGSLEQGSAVGLVTGDKIIQSHSGYDTISNAFAIVDA